MPAPSISRFAAQSGILLPPTTSYKDKPIDYIDPAPKPFEVQIPLVEYFERIKRLRADDWQKHFCQYLQTACENRHIKGTLAEFHAEPQLGKTTILSQVFVAWKIGHDPFWREILAMYNQSRSETHSRVVIQILQSALHKEIFPNTDGHLPKVVSVEGWSTNARLDAENGRMDGQKSFTAAGLISGITGSGADGYTIDDPYKNPKEAYSPEVRRSLELFWTDGINARLSPYDCVFSMFHRYAYDDFGGFLLDTGRFDYVRYATVGDGDYLHESTGQRFTDPLNRQNGEYISERRGDDYYKDKKTNPGTWASMFQGRPSTEEGEFFQVNKIRTISGEELEQERKKCVIWIRAYDSASTAGGGDYSVSAKIGIQMDGRVLVDDMRLAQVNSEGYAKMQKDTAEEDGFDVVVCIPKPLSDAGSHIVFHTQQLLQDYTVVSRSVAADTQQIGSTAKKRRAYNYSTAVNTGQVMFASDADYPEDKKWIELVKRTMRQFGLSAFDDPVDAMADGYNEAFERLSKGLIIKNFRPQVSIRTWSEFCRRFKITDKIPDDFTVYAGVTITPEANRPNSAVIVVRPPQREQMPDTLFLVAEYKDYTDKIEDTFEWLEVMLQICDDPKAATVWLHPDSETHRTVIWQKLKCPVVVFAGDKLAGISELNWYLQELPEACSLNDTQKATRLYGLITDEGQLTTAINDEGLVAFRQEASSWGYTDKGEPSQVGAVLQCLRMIAHSFHTGSRSMTAIETIIANTPKHLQSPEDEQTKVQQQLYMQRELKEQQRRQAERAGKGMNAGRSIDGWRNARQK